MTIGYPIFSAALTAFSSFSAIIGVVVVIP